MLFTEIGQQLRAYRLESGLRAEEIAARLGVSRAALYRYEKGEVIKLDTIKRLAELLKISPLSLLGIGVEYYNRPIGYFERIRQVEETADQILQLHWAGSATSPHPTDYDAALSEAFDEECAWQCPGRPIRCNCAASPSRCMGIQIARKRMYAHAAAGHHRHDFGECRCSISWRSASAGSLAAIRAACAGICRDVAVLGGREHRHADGDRADGTAIRPAGWSATPSSARSSCMRARDRASLAVNPFRPDTHPSAQTGVAMITGADEAVAAHQRVAEGSWREAIKGPAGRCPAASIDHRTAAYEKRLLFPCAFCT